MTTYYQTIPETGELLSGPHEARVDPRSGQPLIPRGGVTTAPPSVNPGEVAVWSGGQWIATEDHRGETGFVAGQQMTIRELGPLPEGWTTEDPTAEPEPDPHPEGRKIWPSADKFLAEFSTPEDPFSILSAISLSTDPAVAALRLVLTTHPGEVWSDDPRVVLGMAALVAAEIIDEQMSSSILDPAPAPAEN